jgi:hypothetical protein
MADDLPARHVLVLAPMPLEMHAIVKAIGVQPTTANNLDPWRGRVGSSTNQNAAATPSIT